MITFHHETFNVVTKKLHIDGKLHFEKLTLHIYVYCCMYCMHFTLLISNVAGCGLFVDSAEASHFTHHTIFHIITVTSVYIITKTFCFLLDLLFIFLFLLDLFIASPNSAVFNCQPAIRHFQKKGYRPCFHVLFL